MPIWALTIGYSTSHFAVGWKWWWPGMIVEDFRIEIWGESSWRPTVSLRCYKDESCQMRCWRFLLVSTVGNESQIRGVPIVVLNNVIKRSFPIQFQMNFDIAPTSHKNQLLIFLRWFSSKNESNSCNIKIVCSWPCFFSQWKTLRHFYYKPNLHHRKMSLKLKFFVCSNIGSGFSKASPNRFLIRFLLPTRLSHNSPPFSAENVSQPKLAKSPPFQ